MKEDVSDGKIDEATAKKYINAAKKAISDAMWTFEVSNDTTAADILKMAMDAADNNDVIITLDKANFKIVKSSSTVNGTVSATLTLKCGTVEDAVPAAKTLPLIVNETTKAIDEDRHLISVAVDEIAYDNRTTKEEMLEAAKKAVKNGTEVSWKSFNKINATFKEDGNIFFHGFAVAVVGRQTAFFTASALRRNFLFNRECLFTVVYKNADVCAHISHLCFGGAYDFEIVNHKCRADKRACRIFARAEQKVFHIIFRKVYVHIGIFEQIEKTFHIFLACSLRVVNHRYGVRSCMRCLHCAEHKRRRTGTSQKFLHHCTSLFYKNYIVCLQHYNYTKFFRILQQFFDIFAKILRHNLM